MPEPTPSQLRPGAWLWILAAQFFVAQVVVASAWTEPFSLATRYISDLGNTACGRYPASSSLTVCSPWHVWMNGSFIAIGITMAGGALLTGAAFVRGWAHRIAVALFVAAGLGVILVGVYPENVNIARHALGAGVNFLAGNVALVLFGLSSRSGRGRAFLLPFSIVAGCLGLAGTVLFGFGYDLGLGAGTMERIAAYPMPVWQIAAGLTLLLV